ncbi:MAG: hypothetical protein HYS89_01815 [Candidatus Colwellbacteria bacterium]|nr:hypothetical protein [Candidatus Colwellbacteria bacterium]
MAGLISLEAKLAKMNQVLAARMKAETAVEAVAEQEDYRQAVDCRQAASGSRDP